MSLSAGKVALVSGGSAGIGRGCVEAFVRDGASVVFCSNQLAEGKQLEAELNAAGPGKALFIEADCRNEADLQAVVSRALELHGGRLDWLINNVGWHPDHAAIDDFSLADLRSLMELNVYSAFTLAKLCLPSIRATRGAIVNMSSVVATIGQHHAVTYAITKAALAGFTRALAIDEAMHGVRVNSVSPGNILTPLLLANSATRGSGLEGELAKFAGLSLFKRLGTIEEVGTVCLFLCRDAAYCTGIDVPVTGGSELAQVPKADDDFIVSPEAIF